MIFAVSSLATLNFKGEREGRLKAFLVNIELEAVRDSISSFRILSRREFVSRSLSSS